MYMYVICFLVTVKIDLLIIVNTFPYIKHKEGIRDTNPAIKLYTTLY